MLVPSYPATEMSFGIRKSHLYNDIPSADQGGVIRVDDAGRHIGEI